MADINWDDFGLDENDFNIDEDLFRDDETEEKDSSSNEFNSGVPRFGGKNGSEDVSESISSTESKSTKATSADGVKKETNRKVFSDTVRGRKTNSTMDMMDGIYNFIEKLVSRKGKKNGKGK
jgi:hypothetical protein